MATIQQTSLISNKPIVKKPRFRPEPNKWSNRNLTLSWLGHASFLLNFYGTKIIVDPTFCNRIGITIGKQTLGPKRHVASPILAKELSLIDLLLISHAHTDHFDYPSLRDIQSDKTSVITAKNTKKLWDGLRYEPVNELDWGKSKSIKGVTVTAIEGEHWGARLPWNQSMTANSYLISKEGTNIFFGADTAYTDKIQEQLSGISIDVAIMGIGAYMPVSLQKHHATPEQAVKIAKNIGAKIIIPMHFGTFRLSREPINEPIQRFRSAMSGELERIGLQEIGETWIKPY